jgi:hypothetical protein
MDKQLERLLGECQDRAHKLLEVMGEVVERIEELDPDEMVVDRMTFRFDKDGDRYKVVAYTPNNLMEMIGFVEKLSNGCWRGNTKSESPVGTRFKTRRSAAEALYAQRFGCPELVDYGRR